MTNKRDMLSTSELSHILFGTMVGVGILSLPGKVVLISWQDGWISSLVGGIYPLYIGIIAIFLCKRYPNLDILQLSKIYFGRYLGFFLNLVFIFNFFFIIISAISAFSNVIRIYIVPFLTPLKIISVSIILGLYLSYKGIKVIGRVNTVCYFITLSLIPMTFIAFNEGSILNVQPVFGAGLKNILKASTSSTFSYSGIEIAFLLYPALQDKNGINKAVFISAFETVLLYSYFTFMAIYYLSPDIVVKSIWPTLTLTESIEVPVLNTFRFLFMSIWSITIFKTIGNYYFALSYSLNNQYNKISRENYCFYIFPIAIVLSLLLESEINRAAITTKIHPYLFIYNLIYTTSLAIIIIIRGVSNGKK